MILPSARINSPPGAALLPAWTARRLSSQGRRHHQVRKLRHHLGKKKHDGRRQDDSER